MADNNAANILPQKEMAVPFESKPAVRAGGDMARQAADTMEHSGRALGAAPPQKAEGGAEGGAAAAAGGGLDELRQGAAGLAGRMAEVNLRATRGLFHLAGPADVIAWQQQWLRDTADMMLEGGAMLVHMARVSAEQSLRPLEQGIAQRRAAREG